MEEIKILKKEFVGRGEVRGFHFTQIYMHDLFYVYKVDADPEGKGHVYYELIMRKIMFGREAYPGSRSFGIYGWTQPTLERISESIKEHFNLDIKL